MHFNTHFRAYLVAEAAGCALVTANKNSRMVSGFVETFRYFKAFFRANRYAQCAAFTFVYVDNYLFHNNILSL